MDRIRCRGEIPSFWSGIYWPVEGIVLPDGCIPDRQAVADVPQIILEHSDDDGATWSVVDGVGGGAGKSPTSDPVPSSDPAVPDFGAAMKRGIQAFPQQPIANRVDLDAVPTEDTSPGNKSKVTKNRGKWK